MIVRSFSGFNHIDHGLPNDLIAATRVDDASSTAIRMRSAIGIVPVFRSCTVTHKPSFSIRVIGLFTSDRLDRVKPFGCEGSDQPV